MNEQPNQNPSVEQIRNLPGVFDPTSFAAQEAYGQKAESKPRTNPRVVTASANVNPLDDEVRVDSTAASVTMTLETAVGCDGRRHTFKKTVAANSMIIDGNGSETIDGAATVTLTAQYGVVMVISNGTNWDLEYAGPGTVSASGITILAEQATTSGTAIDFTIPSGAKRVTVMYTGVSTNGTSNHLIQLGDAGGIETTGYVSTAVQFDSTVAVTNFNTATAGFIPVGAPATGDAWSGAVTLSLQDVAGFTWVGGGTLHTTTTKFSTCSGIKSLSAELTTVRVTSVTPNTFDAGAVSVSWE